MMKKRCVLMSGRLLCGDHVLDDALQKIADVVKSSANSQVEAIMATRPVELVLFEVSQEHPAEVEIIKTLKQQFPNTVIIVIDGDGDREVIARAFSYGAKDAFRKPYKKALIVERVKAILSRMSRG